MKSCIALLLCALLGACAGPRLAPRPEQLFSDQLFSAPTTPINTADVFALSDDMKSYLNNEMNPMLRSKGFQRGLIEALYSKQQLKIEYDSTMTRNAAQAFSSRTGNCLSLVIMTAAFAKQLNMQIQYQSVLIDDAWSRVGDIGFLSGHVNLSLGRPGNAVRSILDADSSLTIDFLPQDELQGQRTRQIDEQTVLAMYYNNRAAETMVSGPLSDAYWLARTAIMLDPSFLSAYNTLGVIYHLHNNFAQAEKVLRYAMEREPRNPHFMSNMVLVLDDLGRHDEANLMKQQLARIDPYPPFHFFKLGQDAMQRGDYAGAQKLFEKELDRSPYYHEFHFWMGAADYRLGQYKQASKEFELAIENSTTRTDHDLYAAKLDRLRAQMH